MSELTVIKKTYWNVPMLKQLKIWGPLCELNPWLCDLKGPILVLTSDSKVIDQIAQLRSELKKEKP